MQQLQLAGRFLRHRFHALHPYEVQAVLLNACNLRCAYCCCPDIKTALLTTDQWLATIRRLAELGTLRLKWQGGEPTIRKDFAELCAAVQAAGIVCAVVTNGTQIAERPELLAHVDEVVLSLDSLTPAHTDRVRGAGVHAAVMRAVEVARAAPRPPRLFMNMVVMRDNLDEMEPMLRFCEQHDIGLNIQPAVFGTAYYDDAAQPLALEHEQTRAMYRQLAEWKRAGRRLLFGAHIYQRAAGWDDYGVLARRNGAAPHCAMGRFYVHVEANGDVHPCVQHSATFTPKNIARDGVDAALANAQRHDCTECFGAYLNERKDLFSLQPRAVLGYLRR
jgi:MoaA/NifB/PqqE/SkfB family radical SAM enzyme